MNRISKTEFQTMKLKNLKHFEALLIEFIDNTTGDIIHLQNQLDDVIITIKEKQEFSINKQSKYRERQKETRKKNKEKKEKDNEQKEIKLKKLNSISKRRKKINDYLEKGDLT